MVIKLLIATSDNSYQEHLSKVLSNIDDGLYDITTITRKSNFAETLRHQNFDVVLFEESMFDIDLDFKKSKLFFLLVDDETNTEYFEKFPFVQRINKYQRISNISREMLDYYSKVADSKQLVNSLGVNITAVFSPAGGCGKTSVAIAYAMKLANMGNDSDVKNVFYLNLENFASTHAYFPDSGKSLSDILSKLDKANPLTLMALKQRDERSGISYFTMPNNYDDINIITEDDIDLLVEMIIKTELCDELVIDLSNLADKKTIKVLTKADNILLVTEPSQVAQQKIKQFVNQSNVFENIKYKVKLIINKGRNEKFKIDGIDKSIKLPLLNLTDCYAVCENLAKIIQKEMTAYE